MNHRNLLNSFTKILIDIMFYSGIVVCFLIPILFYTVDGLKRQYGIADKILLPSIAVILFAGIMCVFALSEIRRMFKTLVNKNPFIVENAKSLRKIAVISFLVAIDFLIKAFFWLTVGTFIITIIFTVAGLFCLVLADVFEQAVDYKKEVDLTI